MLIAIDHGNKQIKTAHQTFSSGLCESDTQPPFGENILRYKRKYYTLSDQWIPYMRDKTTDERFFILTLFAIAFELRYLRYPATINCPPCSILHASIMAWQKTRRKYAAPWEKAKPIR